jgi:hypothetical protein
VWGIMSFSHGWRVSAGEGDCEEPNGYGVDSPLPSQPRSLSGAEAAKHTASLPTLPPVRGWRSFESGIAS